MSLPRSLQEFDELVTKHITQHAKRYGKTLTRSQGEADFRLHYSSIAAIEPELREATELRESEDAATWEKLGLSPEAARIASRVEQQSAPKPLENYQYEDWQSLLD